MEWKWWAVQKKNDRGHKQWAGRNRARNGLIEKRADSKRRGGKKIAEDKVRRWQRGSAGAARYC